MALKHLKSKLSSLVTEETPTTLQIDALVFTYQTRECDDVK